MKAAVFHADHDIRVSDVPAPDGAGPGQVLLRPYWCGICGTDLHEYAMGPIVIPTAPHPLNGSTAPQILGHEFSAEVVEVGAGVTHLKPGQRVSVMPLLYCGECYFCRRGLNHLCQRMACVGLSYGWGGIAKVYGPDWHVTAQVAGDDPGNLGVAKDVTTYLARTHWNPVKSAAGVVHGDPHLLFEAFSNLVANAIKFTPGGGRVVLRASSRSEGIRVELDDSGPGIPSIEREAVLQRFYRGECGRDPGVEGHGLGLSIVSAIVRLHGFRLRFEDNAGGGACVVVECWIESIAPPR